MKKLFVLKRAHNDYAYLTKDTPAPPNTNIWTYTQNLDDAKKFYSHDNALWYIYQANTNARVHPEDRPAFNAGDELSIVEIVQTPPQYKEV